MSFKSAIEDFKNNLAGKGDIDEGEMEEMDISETFNAAATNAKPHTPSKVSSGNPSFILVRPERFDDSITIADYVIEGKTVVLNLEATGKELSRRIIDILSGTAYAVGAQIKNVSVGTYLIIPGGSDFSGDNSDMVDTSSFSL